jgi:hypothetical protein
MAPKKKRLLSIANIRVQVNEAARMARPMPPKEEMDEALAAARSRIGVVRGPPQGVLEVHQKERREMLRAREIEAQIERESRRKEKERKRMERKREEEHRKRDEDERNEEMRQFYAGEKVKVEEKKRKEEEEQRKKEMIEIWENKKKEMARWVMEVDEAAGTAEATEPAEAPDSIPDVDENYSNKMEGLMSVEVPSSVESASAGEKAASTGNEEVKKTAPPQKTRPKGRSRAPADIIIRGTLADLLFDSDDDE